MRKQTISLCMIVKDEEDCIENCLSSVINVVDEIIIVDTGSLDNTVNICNSFGAKIYSYTWNNNFSSARNYGLQFATGDWILWLDADEKMDTEDGRKLKKYLNQNNNEDVICVQLINYLGGVEDLNNSYCMDQQRIFRNFKGINFTNTIHETLSLNGVVKKIKFTDIKILPIKVYHFGYMDSRVLYKKKSQRNLEILQREVLKEDHSPWVEYHLASELYNIKEYYLSFYYINVSIKKFLEQEELPPPLIYLLKYSILFNIGDLNTICLAIDHAISLYPDYVDLIFLKGKILFKNKDYTNALRSFEKCIKLKGGSSSIYLSLKGTGSFISWYYKGRCLEHMNNIQGAKLAYQTSLLAYPNYTPAKEALSNIRLYHV